jgi:hypothetical protein
VKVKSATVVPDKVDKLAGHVHHEKMFRGLNPANDMSDRVRLQIERDLTIALAGRAAQRRYSKKSWRHYHGKSDLAWASDLALRIGGDGEGATAFLRWIELRTDRLVAKRWRDIEHVARKLVKHKTMTGAEIVDVIDGETGIQFRKLGKRLRELNIEGQQDVTERLTGILNPVFEKIEQALGFKSPDQKLRSRIISAVRRSCMAYRSK